MLSELAGELRAARDEHRRDTEQLRADLAGLSTLVGENADLLGQVMPRVSDLDVELGELADRVDALAGVVASIPGAGGPAAQDAALVDWPSLPADAAAAEWQALGDWVAGVLGPFYELTRAQLPDCWPLHRPAVLELVWLRRTYVAAHRPDALPSAAADWHTRWRREALANIAAAISDKWCRPGEHWVDRYERSRPVGGPPPPPPAPPRHVPGQRPGPENHNVGPGGEISTPQHWGAHFQTAARDDIAWRRQRDAAASDSPPGT
ncbi:hypothetical protein ACU61A_41105 [Pseudonocardia sichuanensis]